MTSRRRAALASVLALGTAGALAATAPTSTAASGSSDRGVVVAGGLTDPWGVQSARGGHRGLVVAQNSGKVTRVFLDGKKKTILTGVPGVAGVAAGPKRVFAVIGGPNESGGPPSGGKYGATRVLRMDYEGKHVKVIANLERYELKHNPDGQKQFGKDGKPLDALSNPFAMTWSKHGLFVADGGANDVLRIDPATGRVSTFFVPPTVKDKKPCQSPEANQPGTKGCDPVPTGVQVLDGSLYVSTLGAEAPGAGRIYKLNARTGKVQNVWRNLTGPTGVAVRRDGTIFFSQVLHNAPQGQPGPDFDPSTVGRIVRIEDGHRTFAQVPMPIGLLLRDGKLYSSSWSVAGAFMGAKGAGTIVRVPMSAFKRRS
jgi:hypothetical protein